MRSRATRATRPKSAGAIPDERAEAEAEANDVAPEPAPAEAVPPSPVKKGVTFALTMADDLFAATLCRVVDDPRMSIQNFPPPPDGYARASWRARVGAGPVAPALGLLATEAAHTKMAPDVAAARMVEALFSGGLNTCRMREDAQEAEDHVLDGRAIAALMVVHFCITHSASVAALRSSIHTHKLDMDEQRALWDALDAKEERWAGKPTMPPLETALWAVYRQPPGPVDATVAGELAWAIYEALRTRSPGDLTNELLESAFSMSEWAKTMRDDMPHEEAEPDLLAALVAAPHVKHEAKVLPDAEPAPSPLFVKQEAPLAAMAAAFAPPSWAPNPTSEVPSWAPSIVTAAPSTRAQNTRRDDNDFERQLREACLQTELRRRAAI